MRAEKKRQELTAQLASQARIFDTALSNTPDLIYTFDLEGRFTYATVPCWPSCRRRPEQVVGKNFFELDYPDELAARLQRQIQEVIDTKSQVQDETPYTGAFGTRYYEYIFVPVLAPDGTVEAVAGSTRDITERKQAEVATRRRALQLQKLAEVATRVNSAHDVNSVVGVVTEEARNIIGAEKAATSMVLNPTYPQPINVISTPTGQPPQGGPARHGSRGAPRGGQCERSGPIRLTQEDCRRTRDGRHWRRLLLSSRLAAAGSLPRSWAETARTSGSSNSRTRWRANSRMTTGHPGPALADCGHRHRERQALRGAQGKRSAQGRVPGDARPRAQEPAGGHRQCRRRDQPQRPPRASRLVDEVSSRGR